MGGEKMNIDLEALNQKLQDLVDDPMKPSFSAASKFHHSGLALICEEYPNDYTYRIINDNFETVLLHPYGVKSRQTDFTEPKKLRLDDWSRSMDNTIAMSLETGKPFGYFHVFVDGTTGQQYVVFVNYEDVLKIGVQFSRGQAHEQVFIKK